MSKTTKAWLIVATVFLLIGGILFAGVMTTMGWNFKKLSTDKFVNKEYKIDETFQNISVRTVTADITFVPTDGKEVKVTCYEDEKVPHNVGVKDGTLVIDALDNRKWYHYIGIHFEKPKITVSIPKGEYGALTVKNTTGDVEIPKGFTFSSAEVAVTTGDISLASSAKAVRCECTTGDIKLTGIRCESLSATGSTGDVNMQDVIATGKITVERTTGDIAFSACDAAELYMKVTTGDVEGTLLSGKLFEVKTTTGKVNVPSPGAGGLCKVKTTTGSIRIDIE